MKTLLPFFRCSAKYLCLYTTSGWQISEIILNCHCLLTVISLDPIELNKCTTVFAYTLLFHLAIMSTIPVNIFAGSTRADVYEYVSHALKKKKIYSNTVLYSTYTLIYICTSVPIISFAYACIQLVVYRTKNSYAFCPHKT